MRIEKLVISSEALSQSRRVETQLLFLPRSLSLSLSLSLFLSLSLTVS